MSLLSKHAVQTVRSSAFLHACTVRWAWLVKALITSSAFLRAIHLLSLSSWEESPQQQDVVYHQISIVLIRPVTVMVTADPRLL